MMLNQFDVGPAGPLNALIINDNELETQLIEMLLKNESIDCYAASDETEAIAILNSVVPKIIIASWRIGSVDGRGIVNVLKRHSRLADIPGVLITDRKLSLQQRMECTREGFTWIVQAPFTPENFARLVKMLINNAAVPVMSTKHKPTGVIPQGSCPALQAVSATFSGLLPRIS